MPESCVYLLKTDNLLCHLYTFLVYDVIKCSKSAWYNMMATRIRTLLNPQLFLPRYGFRSHVSGIRPRASSPRRSGGGAGNGRRACKYVSGIWIPPPIPLWLPADWVVRFPLISANVNKQKKRVPRVMTSLLMSSPPICISRWLFRCRYSNSREVVASCPSFSRPDAS